MKLGLKRGEVRLVPHQPEWDACYTEEKRHLANLLADTVIQIEHIGSTAVPDLPAKPIIDIAIAVRSIEDIAHWSATLVSDGYIYFGDREGRGDHFFAKGPEDCRSFYLHVVPRESSRWNDYLRFREEYAQLKTSLCDAHSRDRAAYTSAKDGLIRRVLNDVQQDTPSNGG